MDASTPTHFNVIVLGTGLPESIAAAALSKAGYSLLHLDRAPVYGDTWASLSLADLVSHPRLAASTTLHAPELLAQSGRFALSLFPVLMRAQGPAIRTLIQSKVAAYLGFGLLAGVGLVRAAAVHRVPGTKSEVFNDPGMSLVEKRRLTKLLLFAAGDDPFEESPLLPDKTVAFHAFLQTAFSLSLATASSLAYALSLSSSPLEPALPALTRLRALIRSTGLYGPSPFLVGHYGGAGDLVGGFSRVCAVWGGGQILGRPIHPLLTSTARGIPAAAQPLFGAPSTSAPPPPPPPSSEGEAGSEGVLGVPVTLDKGGQQVVFTADWVLCAPSHYDLLFPPSSGPPSSSSSTSSLHFTSVQAIVVLPFAIPFPPAAGDADDAPDPADTVTARPDSHLFVFEPEGLRTELGTATCLQVGSGTNSCPEDYFVLYLSAPILDPAALSETTTPEELLRPFLDALLELVPVPVPVPGDAAPLQPALTSWFFTPLPQPLSPPPPPNVLVTPALASAGTTAGLVDALDESAAVAEDVFWRIVGDRGREEGVVFFGGGGEGDAGEGML